MDWIESRVYDRIWSPQGRGETQEIKWVRQLEGGYAEKYKELIDIMDKMTQAGSLKIDFWADNTGHSITWFEFDSIESYAKLWSVDDWHKRMIIHNQLVDNMRIRLLRPVRMITEDLIP